MAHEDIDYIRAKLKPMSILKRQELAKALGVPWKTIVKVYTGETRNPRIDTVSPFLDYFRDRDKKLRKVALATKAS